MRLYDHQKRIIDDDPKKCLLALGTGSGKTITALHLARGRTLVVTPKTVRDDRLWERNLEKTGLVLDMEVVSKEDFRLGKHKGGKYDTLICDEAHQVAGATPDVRYVKRQQVPKCSKIFDALVSFIRITNPERVYMLTATPDRSPMCVWGLATLLGKDWDFWRFRDAFYFPVRKGFRDLWMVRKDGETKDRLAKAVGKLGYASRLSDYFDVPDQTYREMRVELTSDQKGRIRALRTQFPDPIVLVGKTHQVENGVLAGDEFTEPETFENGKIAVIKDLAKEFPKMVIFAKYTAQIAQIAEALRDDELPLVLTLEGSTKDREGVIRAAEEAGECVFVVQSQISAGYELPSFPVMVFASMSYSVVDRIQAEGRILRANALKKNLYITLVATGGVDAAVRDSIENKKDFNERLFCQKV